MDATNVIRASKIDGNKIYITQQLARDTYNQVARVLAKYNVKWNRREKAHVIPMEYMQDFMAALDNGFTEKRKSVQQQIGFFQTPEPLAEELCLQGPSIFGCSILEPSGGYGRIVDAALNAGAGHVVTVENYPSNVDMLRDKYLGNEDVTIHAGDFLEKNLGDLGGELFDAVLMNPPFAKGQDIEHFMHAINFVKPGGIITAIMSASVGSNSTKKYENFRSVVRENGGRIVKIPSGSFKSEVTAVETVMVHITFSN